MSWLTPLGFLGLISIIILIIIYIIKPNYQQKIISSTFVWKLSLKYRKKKLPISKLRTLLLLLCQILALTAGAFILAQPYIKAEFIEFDDKIIIVDASANMLASHNRETRFERAIRQVKNYSGQVFAAGGNITVIIADDEADYLVGQRLTVEDRSGLNAALDELVVPNNLKCTYGKADMEGAVKLAEDVLYANPKSEIYLYTATEYLNKNGINVVNVADDNEWNAAILDATMYINDNYYNFDVDVACYGRDAEISVYCAVSGINGSNYDALTAINVQFANNESQRITFKEFYRTSDDAGVDIFSFESVRIYFEESDSYKYDDSFYIYGGSGVQYDVNTVYYSLEQNVFIPTTLLQLQNDMRGVWNVFPNEKYESNSSLLIYEDYDYYIYEHIVPSRIPEDGVVILINPNGTPRGLDDIEIAKNKEVLSDYEPFYVAEGKEEHPILSHVNVSDYKVHHYSRVTAYDGYEVLAYCNADPVLLVKNEPSRKIIVFCLDYKWSTASITYHYPILLRNFFNYFFPQTFTERIYEVGENIVLNARGNEFVLSNQTINYREEINEFPKTVKFEEPGTYTTSQRLINGENLEEMFYVKIASSESDVERVYDELPKPIVVEEVKPDDLDLLLYFAAALVALLFLEWWLQSRSYLN